MKFCKNQDDMLTKVTLLSKVPPVLTFVKGKTKLDISNMFIMSTGQFCFNRNVGFTLSFDGFLY